MFAIASSIAHHSVKATIKDPRLLRAVIGGLWVDDISYQGSGGDSSSCDRLAGDRGSRPVNDQTEVKSQQKVNQRGH